MTQSGRQIITACLGPGLIWALFLPGCRPPPPREPLQDIDPLFVIPAIADAADDSRPSRGTVAELVSRLDDEDAAVRWAAHEALKKLSGRDFGYEPWLGGAGEGSDRSAAIARWRDWARTNGRVSPEQLLR